MSKIILIMAVLAAGCGSSSSSARIALEAAAGPVEQPKLPPVKPEAMREFEAGMRALRLAGSEPDAAALGKARERLQRAAELDGKLWEAWHNLGVIRFQEGDDDAAVDAFSRALDINPAHLESVLARAEAHRRAGHGKQARGDYETVVARSPDDSPMKRNGTARLASQLREANQYDDAIAVIRETLRTAGANAKVYVELGMVYMAQGRGDLAELVLTKAVELDPREPSIYNALALLDLGRGRSHEAFNRFDHATSLDPSYMDARFNKASVLLDAGDFGRAKDELLAVVGKNPDDVGARVALGVAHRGLGEYDQARAQWERVVERAPRRSRARGDALYNLAILSMSFLENDKGAAGLLERYLNEAPANHPKRKEAEEKKKELGL